MRMERSLKNSATVLISQFFSMGLAFITRTIFIYTLSQDYLGVNGVFTSVLSLLSVSELGIGTAITFALYRPLAEKNERQISALMRLYGKAYRIIGVVIFLLGLALYPFWQAIVGEIPSVPHLPLIYLLFLSNTSLSYFFTYKRSLIAADQRESVNVLNQCVFLLIQNVLQIALLYWTHAYLLYLIAQIVCTFAGNVAISRRADRMYPFLRKNRDARLDADALRAIRHNVAAMIMHQLGSALVTGTDTLMIAWVDIKLEAVYSNYMLIIQTLSTILRQIFHAITASVGNLLAVEDEEKQYDMYRNILFLNFWIYGFCAIALTLLMNPFILIWAQAHYVLPYETMLLIVLNFFLFGMRQTNIMFINTAGLFWQLRFKTFVESLLNLIASFYFLLACKMGIQGVLLGTVVSTLLTNFWWEPYALYHYRFARPLWDYVRQWIGFLFAFAAAYFPTRWLCHLFPTVGILPFLMQMAICAVVPNLIFLLLYHRTRPFAYLRTVLEKVGNMMRTKPSQMK